MKNFKFVHEAPEHFILHNGKSHFHIAKNGIDVPTTEKIRALAKGGQIQSPQEAGIEAEEKTKRAQAQQSPEEKQIEADAKQQDPTDYVKYNNPDKFAEGGKLSSSDRAHIAHKNFAGPDRSYPIEDASHARNALARVSQHGSPELKAQVRAKVHAKYPGIEQSYDDGGTVTPVQTFQDSFRKATHYADGGDIQEQNPGLAETVAKYFHKPTPAPTPQPSRDEEYAKIRAQNTENMKTGNYAGGGPVASNSVDDISHETQSQAIGRYAAGNPANLAKGGATHHTQGKYHFHFYDGGPVTHSDKYPEAPATPLDNYVNQAEPTGTVGEDAADQGVTIGDKDLDPNATLNLQGGALPETDLQKEIDAASQAQQPPSATESANNLARTMGKDLPFPEDQPTPPPSAIPPSQQISVSNRPQASAIPDKSDMLGQLNADIKGEQEAILGGKTAEAKGFAAQSQAIQNNLDQQQKANEAYQNEVNQITKQNTDLFNNVRTNKINPNQFWDNKSTGAKITAGIALLLGGVSAGLSGKSNPALDVIQKSIQNDIEGQKLNQEQGVNLYKLGLEKYRDTQAAHQYATLQANALLQGQLSKIAAQTGSQTAQFNAQQAIHQIGLQNAELRSNLALRQAAISSMNAQPTNRGGLDLNKSRLLQMSGIIPKEEQSNVDKESEDYQKLSNYLDEVDDLAKRAGGNATYTERIAQGIPGGSMLPTFRDSTKEYLAQTNAFLDKATKDLTGRVTPQSMENLKHSLPVAGDSPAVTASKISTLKDIGRSGYHFPTLQKYTIIGQHDPVATPDATRRKKFTPGPAK